MPNKSLLLIACAFTSLGRLLAADPTPAPSSTLILSATATVPHHTDASSPSEKMDGGKFRARHEVILKRGKEGPIGVLFLGDSITEFWTKAPDVWKSSYEKYDPANFGISGDGTQHVLWRIENGELDGIHPKVVVLMIGTNNTGVNTAPEIAAADKKIIQEIRAKLPESKILLLAIFPRGPRKQSNGTMDDGVMKKEKIHAANLELAKLDDGSTVRFLDIGDRFLDASGNIPPDVMPDQLHPSPKGYQIWATAMQPLLDEMMKNAK